jgi:hypothetical protein
MSKIICPKCNTEMEDNNIHEHYFWTDCVSNLQKQNATLTERLKKQDESNDIPCCECGGKVEEFTVQNELWNAVMRPDEHETDKEYLCFECWNKRLMKHIATLTERLKAAEDDAEREHDMLEHARLFIKNGIAIGCIQLPDKDLNDPASKTYDLIMDVMAQHEALVAQEAK